MGRSGSVDVQWDDKGTKRETQHGNELKTKMLASKNIPTRRYHYITIFSLESDPSSDVRYH